MSSVRVRSRAVPPAAIVFDCDGLLLDTEGCWSVGETALFARHGLAFGDDHKQALIGVAMSHAGPILEKLLASPGRGAELTNELVELVVAEVTRVGCTPMPGALELLAMLRGRVPLGVASNAPRPVFRAAIAAAGVSEWFGAVVSADDVDRPKPAPDVYLEACRRLAPSPPARSRSRTRRPGSPRRAPPGCGRSASRRSRRRRSRPTSSPGRCSTRPSWPSSA